MSKITFRADDDLVERLEAYDASKSEVMREALRSYLDGTLESDGDDTTDSAGEREGIEEAITERIDAIVADRIDELIDDRMDDAIGARADRGGPAGTAGRHTPQDVNVTVTLDGVAVSPTDDGAKAGNVSAADDVSAASDVPAAVDATANDGGSPDDDEVGPKTESGSTCKGCGTRMEAGDVYCPNCGEKNSHRAFCECGDEVRTDWGFCPSCGRRTPAAGVLDPR